MKRLPILLRFALLALLALPHPVAAADRPASGEAVRLHALFDREWETRLKEDPLTATSVGRHEYDALLPEATVAEFEREAQTARGFLKELAAIDRAQLSPADLVNADIWKHQLEEGIAGFELGLYQMPFNADSGFHSEFAQLSHLMPLATTRDYENYISRLRAWPRLMDQEIVLMKMGIARGFTIPKAVLTGYDATITAYIVTDPEKSEFYAPFEHYPAMLPEADRERLAAAGRKAIEESIVPAYKKFLDFYRNDYYPHARTTIGAYDLPNGKAFYAQQIETYTTLNLTPQEIHKLGLSEVDRITQEMHAVIEKVGFKGDFPAFLQFLRTDPRFYAKTPQELLERASYIAKRMDGKLPSLFKTLPRLPYTVAPVPDAIAPKYTGGRYVEAPVGSTQAGTYWVNTYALQSRPFYNLEALTFHEAVPGHHLQIARSQELGDLPNFRRYSYISAFGEGWGLYSEWLGLEAGFYTDPYSNFGRLSYEIWRACRLVVDTGIHSMGWTRQQAIDYMATHTALPLHEVETETDRYISWPGQALAYKLGELKIKELRKRAEKALGQGFDVREFHDAVLGSGSVPLTVLEANIDRWIAEQQKGKGDAARSR
jgi:uncharacterized protein (DUF885 family)